MESNNNRRFDSFDQYSENYRDIHNKSIGLSGTNSDYFSEYKIVELLKFENSNDKLKILDFGCGDGNSLVYLRKYFPNAELFGVDVSKESINTAKKKNIPNCAFASFNGSELPYEAEKFDLIFSSMVFHHIDYKLHDGILSGLFGTLKAGGRFYNFEHNPFNPLTRKVVRECSFDKDAVLLKPKYNKNMIIKSGLKIDRMNYTLFFPRHKIFKLFIGLENLLTWCPAGAQYYIRAIK